MSVPSEEELCNRIEKHLAARPGRPDVPIVWQGYLAGLFECGLISGDVYARVSQLLGGVGAEALVQTVDGLTLTTTPRTPTEDELHGRIHDDLTKHSRSPEKAIIWDGYVAALLEWGVISIGAHGRLIKPLVFTKSKAAGEAMLSFD